MSRSGGKLIICGYLRKKSPKGLGGLTLWQRRFFCLYQHVLTYSKDKDDVDHNQGAIPIREMISVQRVRKDPCRFEIIIAGRIFSLLAGSTAEVDSWVSALIAQIGGKRLSSVRPDQFSMTGDSMNNTTTSTTLQRMRSNSDPDLESSSSKPYKYWKDAKTVLDDLNSPDRPSTTTASNAFTKIDLAQLASLSSSTLFSGVSGLKMITIIPPSEEEIEAAIDSPTPTKPSPDQTIERRFDIDAMRVDRILGQGVFGELAVVIDTTSNERYVMQKVSGSLPTASMAINAMRRISSFNNPYIMQCLDYEINEDAGSAWAIFEFVRGEQLLHHLHAHRRLSEPVVRFFVAEIALAVSYLHRKGALFRNLDSEHVALDEAGHIVLTDFRIGLKAVDNEEECRTGEYRTPEYIEGGAGNERPESDWWRLGILTYELLVGFPPFRDKDKEQLNHKISNGVLRFPPFVSSTATDFISKLLIVNADGRLGHGRSGHHTIQEHAFFADINWSAVAKRSQPVPVQVTAIIADKTPKSQSS